MKNDYELDFDYISACREVLEGGQAQSAQLRAEAAEYLDNCAKKLLDFAAKANQVGLSFEVCVYLLDTAGELFLLTKKEERA